MIYFYFYFLGRSFPLHHKDEALLDGHALLATVQYPKTVVEVRHAPDPTLRHLRVELLLLYLDPCESVVHLERGVKKG